VVYREQPDGSLNIEVLPRLVPPLRPAMALAAWGMLIPVGMTICLYYWRGEVWALGMVGLWMLAMLPVLPALIWLAFSAARQRTFIAASPAMLSIWTTEFGDPIRRDWPRDQVFDVRIESSPSGETTLIGLNVYLAGRDEPVFVGIYRRPGDVEDIARRIRQVMNLASGTAAKTPD
jgi:hypothetical protein